MDHEITKNKLSPSKTSQSKGELLHSILNHLLVSEPQHKDTSDLLAMLTTSPRNEKSKKVSLFGEVDGKAGDDADVLFGGKCHVSDTATEVTLTKKSLKKWINKMRKVECIEMVEYIRSFVNSVVVPPSLTPPTASHACDSECDTTSLIRDGVEIEDRSLTSEFDRPLYDQYTLFFENMEEAMRSHVLWHHEDPTTAANGLSSSLDALEVLSIQLSF